MNIFEQMESGDPLSVRNKPSPCSIEERETVLSTGDDLMEPIQRVISTQAFSNDAFGKQFIIVLFSSAMPPVCACIFFFSSCDII